METILIIEDDTDINNLICDTLQKAGYTCKQAFSGTEGLLYAEQDAFVLVILDLMLPGLCGETVLQKLQMCQNVPVIVVSAKDDLDSKVDLLTAGAEDYVTKLFAIKELLARVAVQIRRHAGSAETHAAVLQYQDMMLNRNTFSGSVNGQEISMTKREFQILELIWN